MARDWVAMRVLLTKDPKVMAMADFLSADTIFFDWLYDDFQSVTRVTDRNVTRATRRNARYIAVTALLQVWGLANDAGKPDGVDLLLQHATVDQLDDISEVPHFGHAMVSVGWAKQEIGGVRLPNFLRINKPFFERDESNAERQKRYRERQKANSKSDDSNVTSVTLRNVTDNVTNVVTSNGTGQDRTGQINTPDRTVGADPNRIENGDRKDVRTAVIASIRLLTEASLVVIDSRPATAGISRGAFSVLRTRHLSNAAGLREWFQKQLSLHDPVTGNTKADLLLVLAAAIYATKVPEADVKKSRVAIFIDCIHKQRWRKATRYIDQAVDQLTDLEQIDRKDSPNGHATT